MKQPRRESISSPQAPEVPPRREEGGLPRVLGVLTPPKEPGQIEEERTPELRVEIGERRAVSGLRAFDEGEGGVHLHR